MGSKVDDDNKFSCVIKNFYSLESEKMYSDLFIIGGCQWYLIVYPKGYNNVDNLSLFLEVANYRSLPSGWKRDTRVSFTVVNQLHEPLSHLQEFQKWFDEKIPSWGFGETLPLTLLHDKDSGFLVNGVLKILVEVDVLEAIDGNFDESEEATQPLKKIKQENDDRDNVLSSDIHNKTQQLEESFDVYGFQVLSSQVELVKCLFERHPDIASQVRIKNHNLRTTYINILLGLVKTLCQSPQEITDGDLEEACLAAYCVAKAGFKVDWLEKNLHQVLEKKNRVLRGEAQMSEMEQELLKLNEECSDLKVLLEKEKAEVAAAKIPLSFDDFL